MLKGLGTSAPILAFPDFTKLFKLHTNASTMELGVILFLCQEQDGKDRVILYASRALSKSESHYPVHKLEFLVLKWAATESFQEYLYSNTFALYSNNNPLTYILATAKLDATEHRWIAKLTKFNFMVYYHSRKSNVEADVLSRIPWDQNIKAKAAEVFFKAAVEVPKTLMEAYACHERAISVPYFWSLPPHKWLLWTGFRSRRHIPLLGR